ncbi:MAG: hypothetical protein M1541_11795 [Acidobacteria bacterium]|nr:hypothetical protein [Acidobacteriota bacterium]
MYTKFLLLATLLGGLTIFPWGALSHVALEVPGSLMPLRDGTAVIDAIRSQAPNNGVYFDPRGLLAVVSLRPDMADKSQAMGANLAIEFVSNCLNALLLAFLLLNSRVSSVLACGGLGALAGALAFTGIAVSYWNWYGFLTSFAL